MYNNSKILRYWRAVEIFCPQSIPKLQPEHRDRPTNHFATSDSVASWSEKHKIAKRKIGATHVWKHEVYAGVYELRTLRDFLQTRLGADPESFDSRLDGQSALFSLTVTHDGRPLFESTVLSTCAWAWGRTIAPGPGAPDWLDGFDKFREMFTRQMREMFALLEDDEEGHELRQDEIDVGRPISLADIAALTSWVIEALCLGLPEVAGQTRVLSRVVSEKFGHEADGADFLNSFFLDDLAKVAGEAESDNVGIALRTYLKPDKELDESSRQDVRERLGLPFYTLAPSKFPRGRWPAKGHYPLVYGQQFAINRMTAELGTASGLFGVNGPPGTGKTTMLRDLIASVVVRRAEVLESLAKPSDAFRTISKMKSAQKSHTIAVWAENLTGFEIVVASANNGAVGNVTQEIPGIDAVDPSWLANGFDYLTELASRTLGKPAWGMLAARLGNMGNRAEFIKNFWRDEKTRGDGSADSAQVRQTGFETWLRKQQDVSSDWDAAKDRFRRASTNEDTLRRQRQQWFEALREMPEQVERESALKREVDARKDAERRAMSAADHASDLFDNARTEYTVATSRKAQHFSTRPSILRTLVTLGRARRHWSTEHGLLAADVAFAKSKMHAAEQTRNLAEEVVKSASTLRSGVEGRLKTVTERLRIVREMLSDARRILGQCFPNIGTWQRDELAREKSSPWADPAWDKARVELFLAALALHKAFVVSQARTIRENLAGVIDILGGAVPPDAPRDAVLAAWRTLFFVVPVVSTTFASFDRLFSHLSREDIGWLLIDEAGQAVPQSAVGAIWRARRAVVVGDPLQLEPVLTIPFTTQQALRKRFDVAETWLPGRLSAQKLVDRASRVGTKLLDHERKPIWISAPLRVHRRCDRQMFDVSNKIAYNGSFDTISKTDLPLPPSAWIHVGGRDSAGNWIPLEGRVVLSILHDIAPFTKDKIYVISPFRDVVNGLEALLKRNSVGDVEVGTIHTVQGKESEVVVLVLGSDPRRPGARRWAAEKPNLLNVAVSRARRRLYIVGNSELWSSQKFFDECMSIINVQSGWVPPVELYLQ